MPDNKEKLSSNFTREECQVTKSGIPNVIPDELIPNVKRLLTDVMEPIRSLLGDVPLVVHSFYRCEAVNTKAGGDPKSAHLFGRAADFHPRNMDIKQAFDKIRRSGIPYDKLILEHKDGSWWIHAQVREGTAVPRRLAFIATFIDGKAVYAPAR